MKLSILKTMMMSTSLLTFACGSIPTEEDLTKEENQVLSSQEEYEINLSSALAEDAGDQVEEQASENEVQTEDVANKPKRKTPPEEIKVMFALSHQLRLEAADCAGFGEEARALAARRAELREQGVSKREARETLKEDRKALRELAKDNRETLKECKSSIEGSELQIVHKATIEACFTKPEGKEAPALGLRKGPRGKRGRPGFRLPPKQFADLESEACQAAIATAKSFLDQNAG